MKVLVLTHKGRYDRFAPKDSPAFQAAELARLLGVVIKEGSL